MKKVYISLLTAGLLTISTANGEIFPNQRPEKPNIIPLLTDDQVWR